MAPTLRDKLLMTVLGWSAAGLMFFPIIWMALTSFKPEIEAVGTPSLFFTPSLENYVQVQQSAGYFDFVLNSILISFGATILALALAVPAAYVMAFFPGRRTKDTLLGMLLIKTLPPVGVLVPIFLILQNLGLFNTRTGLAMVYALINLPIVVWMLYSFFKEVPKEILEAGRLDGATVKQELVHILLPLSLPAIASTGLLSVLLSWNEAFWSLNLTWTPGAAPLTAFIATSRSADMQAPLWAAASTMAIAPILVVGWKIQKQLVRGLTFGVVK